MSKPKSANTAGLLGIFTGIAGGHEWYLGRPLRALAHLGVLIISIICLCVGSAIFYGNRMAVASHILPNATRIWFGVGYVIFLLNAIWAAVEGFIILIQGEAGLARRGLAVIDPNTRKTLDPKVKKNIIRYSLIGVGALSAIGIICFVISLIFRVDYGETYRVAKELHSHVRELYDETQCEDVIFYVDSTSTSAKAYEKYLSECREIIDGDKGLIDKLGQTAGIRRDSELSAKYDEFRKAYEATIPSAEAFDQSLKVYQAIHNFYLAINDLNAESTSKQISAAADTLKTSGVKELKEFGEGWQKTFEAYVDAYQAYQADTEADRTSNLYKDMVKARDAYEEWVDDEAPDLDDIADLSLSNVSAMYRAFRNLNDLIRDTYEENYNHNSGDCIEGSTGEVYCP